MIETLSEMHVEAARMQQEIKKLHTSYFKAGNIMDAMQKLYYSRDMNTITVFIVVLNPIS